MLEIVAAIFSLASVLLTRQKNWSCWPMGILGILVYAIVFYSSGLIWQCGLQMVFLVQSVIGWKNWKKYNNNFYTYPIEPLHVLYLISISTVSIFIAYHLSQIFAFSKLDIITSLLSLYANYLLIKKETLAWLVWIIVDILMIWMLCLAYMWSSVVLYVLFLIIACVSFYEWSFNRNKRAMNPV